LTRSLIVNADDFGFTRDTNAGIVEAHRNGILTATTLMAEAPAFDDAVRLAKENPELDVGCHLVLVGMPGYPATLSQLVRDVALSRMDPYARMKPQVETILAAGLRPVHLDTHKHTHLLPPVLEAMARVGEEFGIPWLRQPCDFSGHPGAMSLPGRAMNLIRPHFRRVLERHGLRSTDHFAGFRVTGNYDSDALISILAALPEGVTEFMSHPGFCGPELQAANTRLKASREQELRALTDPRVRQALSENGIRLTRYRELTPALRPV
jgi:predicted glycoside hydrolase/deacetylase ChbG (UPF0249 family)